MNSNWVRTKSGHVAVLFCAGVLAVEPIAAQNTAPATTAALPQTVTNQSTEAAQKLSADQLESLAAPIALYPDPLLAQTLAASTYPLEIVQLKQWLDRHKDLKDQPLAEGVKKEGW